MPADGRYSSIGRCKGTILIGSFRRVIFLFALRVTLLFVVFLATRFTATSSTITITNRHFITEKLRIRARRLSGQSGNPASLLIWCGPVLLKPAQKSKAAGGGARATHKPGSFWAGRII